MARILWPDEGDGLAEEVAAWLDADLRRTGLGRALVERAEAWAVDGGYRELASDTWVDNTASVADHRSLGFDETDRIVCFVKRVAPDPRVDGDVAERDR